MQFKSAIKKANFGVSCHSISPEKTVEIALSKLQKLEQFQNNILENVTPVNDCGVYAHRVKEKEIRYNAWGKGLTEIGSRASALMEYVERFSAENPVFNSKNNPILVPRKDLVDRSFFFDSLSAYNFQHHLYDDHTYFDNKPILWNKVWSLTQSGFAFVPTTRIYPNYQQSNIKDFCCTNGFSANNTIAEAILQGLCEVIERHTLHLHILNKKTPKLLRVTQQEIGNTDLKRSINLLVEKGWFIVINLHETGLPFFTTSIFMINPKRSYVYKSERSYIHFATAADLDTSLSRCLSECVQTMAAEENMRMADSTKDTQPPISIFRDLKYRLSADAYLPLETSTHDTFDEEIDSAVNKLGKMGIEVLVADCTHPSLNIPVVKVICPALQPNFLLRNRAIDSPYAIVSKHIDSHNKIWRLAKANQLSEAYS